MTNIDILLIIGCFKFPREGGSIVSYYDPQSTALTIVGAVYRQTGVYGFYLDRLSQPGLSMIMRNQPIAAGGTCQWVLCRYGVRV